MSDERGGGGFVVAFTLGALVGAVIALLFAPATGEEAREALGEKAKEGAQKTREFLKQQRETLASAVERGREAYHAARDKEPV
ncbi:MAG TPA: YtxH domain-containing protein [Vicinamibacterales bacterium]|nr:YtxH domain-containing protein [Vicinamibacterales bacterium]HOG30512.1 YtxH domain-containing protein [Vicinamibacterales bacterium]HOQ61625.1 YtxH domain-containing protein [Vicinamibacterales bacterium]HPK72066.1 YtxH domain-containing protein [Vicinamibacterales bacterium]HPW20965.1 YtxH domain-containing protein [Vicinamibacterales bacterium]